jgi:hypothetical protein
MPRAPRTQESGAAALVGPAQRQAAGPPCAGCTQPPPHPAPRAHRAGGHSLGAAAARPPAAQAAGARCRVAALAAPPQCVRARPSPVRCTHLGGRGVQQRVFQAGDKVWQARLPLVAAPGLALLEQQRAACRARQTAATGSTGAHTVSKSHGTSLAASVLRLHRRRAAPAHGAAEPWWGCGVEHGARALTSGL